MAPQPLHTLASPADIDNNTKIAEIEQHIQAFKKPGLPYATPANLQKLEDQLAAAKKADRTIGNLLACSGRQMIQAYAEHRNRKDGGSKGKKMYAYPMDWALVALDQDRTIINGFGIEVNKQARKFHRRQKPNFTSNLHEWTDCRVWSHCNLYVGDAVKVAKHGRTAGWTFGLIGVIDPVIRRLGPDTDLQISGAYGFTEEIPGHAWGISSAIYGPPFVQPGDAGSVLVHDGTGAWLGLIFGVFPTGGGLVLPIDLVLRNIEEIASGKVVAPFFERKFPIPF